MKILIDMNLSPAWVSILAEEEHIISHWSTIGSLNASDREILLWAKANGYVLYTHDLDFGAILAATEAEGPSVIQIRAQRRSRVKRQDFSAQSLKNSHARRLVTRSSVRFDISSLNIALKERLGWSTAASSLASIMTPFTG